MIEEWILRKPGLKLPCENLTNTRPIQQWRKLLKLWLNFCSVILFVTYVIKKTR